MNLNKDTSLKIFEFNILLEASSEWKREVLVGAVPVLGWDPSLSLDDIEEIESEIWVGPDVGLRSGQVCKSWVAPGASSLKVIEEWVLEVGSWLVWLGGQDSKSLDVLSSDGEDWESLALKSSCPWDGQVKGSVVEWVELELILNCEVVS